MDVCMERLHTYVHIIIMSDLRILIFDPFLKLYLHVQTARSPRLFDGFQCFLVQNEAEVLLVLFLRFVSYFCFLESTENFETNLELSYFLIIFEKNTELL